MTNNKHSKASKNTPLKASDWLIVLKNSNSIKKQLHRECFDICTKKTRSKIKKIQLSVELSAIQTIKAVELTPRPTILSRFFNVSIKFYDAQNTFIVEATPTSTKLTSYLNITSMLQNKQRMMPMDTAPAYQARLVEDLLTATEVENNILTLLLGSMENIKYLESKRNKAA